MNKYIEHQYEKGYVLCTFFDAYGNPRLFACRE